jgi:hypothetical protein
MENIFLNPVLMILGAALISVPIIIHLINRMRFRRIRWAAMEFLLKSQKRNRRRLIIEQLILLALRCFLVVLAGLLVARFIGNMGTVMSGQYGTAHFIVVDDTLSMADRFKDAGQETTAFEAGKKRVKELATDIAGNEKKQQVKLVKLSNLNTVLFQGELNKGTIGQFNAAVDDIDKPSMLHVRPVEGLTWANAQLSADKTLPPQHIYHFISDIRNGDWSGPEAEPVNQAIDAFLAAGATNRVLLFDVAYPVRHENQNEAIGTENVGIVDFRPDTKYAAKGLPIRFTLVTHNYSSVELKNKRLNVKVNGKEQFINPQFIDVLKGNSDTRTEFELNFIDSDLNIVSIEIEADEGSGLKEDNTRVAVVEVKEQVPILMVDGNEKEGLKPPGDSFFLQTVLTAAKGFRVDNKTVKELETLDLDQYACIYLLNVPEFGPRPAGVAADAKREERLPPVVKKLEDYIAHGKRVAIFVGDKVRPSYYNDVLYDNGKGILPAPLALRPTEKLTDDEKQKRAFEAQYQIYVRDNQMPVFAELAHPKTREWLKMLAIDQWWPTEDRFKWNSDPTRVKELVTLPNRKPMDQAGTNVRGAEIRKRILELPMTEAPYEAFAPGLKKHAAAILNALNANENFVLANALDEFLNDRGNPGDEKNEPDMQKFWALPEVEKLKSDVTTLKEVTQYGDPLVTSYKVGKGEVITFYTTAGRSWNDWAGGCLASWTYPMVMIELQRYLTGVGEDSSRLVGMPLELALNGEQYEDHMDVTFVSALKADAKAPEKPDPEKPGDGAKTIGVTETVRGSLNGNVLSMSYVKTREPGVYRVKLKQKPKPGIEQPADEYRTYVYNVDTEHESPMARANRDMVERPGDAKTLPRVKLMTPDMSAKDFVAPKKKDLSEGPWLYLILLIVLIVEQALAVHLSFHLKGNEASLPPGVRSSLGMGSPATAGAEAAAETAEAGV